MLVTLPSQPPERALLSYGKCTSHTPCGKTLQVTAANCLWKQAIVSGANGIVVRLGCCIRHNCSNFSQSWQNILGSKHMLTVVPAVRTPAFCLMLGRVSVALRMCEHPQEDSIPALLIPLVNQPKCWSLTKDAAPSEHRVPVILSLVPQLNLILVQNASGAYKIIKRFQSWYLFTPSFSLLYVLQCCAGWT